jgi:hypothetical protein
MPGLLHGIYLLRNWPNLLNLCRTTPIFKTTDSDSPSAPSTADSRADALWSIAAEAEVELPVGTPSGYAFRESALLALRFLSDAAQSRLHFRYLIVQAVGRLLRRHSLLLRSLRLLRRLLRALLELLLRLL